jgi:hypothetical protein
MQEMTNVEYKAKNKVYYTLNFKKHSKSSTTAGTVEIIIHLQIDTMS